VVTDRRTVEAENFFDVKKPGNTVLAVDEVIKEIQIPAPRPERKARSSIRNPEIDRLPIVTAPSWSAAAHRASALTP